MLNAELHFLFVQMDEGQVVGIAMNSHPLNTWYDLQTAGVGVGGGGGVVFFLCPMTSLLKRIIIFCACKAGRLLLRHDTEDCFGMCGRLVL